MPPSQRGNGEAAVTQPTSWHASWREIRWNGGRGRCMPQELLFELNNVRITPHIATFSGTSYQIASIGSVHVVRRKKRNPVAVFIFLLGIGTLVAAVVGSRTTGLAEDYFAMAATGVVYHGRGVAASTRLAQAGACADLENIQRRRGRPCVTQQAIRFERSASSRAGIRRSRARARLALKSSHARATRPAALRPIALLPYRPRVSSSALDFDPVLTSGRRIPSFRAT